MSCFRGVTLIREYFGLLGTEDERIEQARRDYFEHIAICEDCRRDRNRWTAPYKKYLRESKLTEQPEAQP